MGRVQAPGEISLSRRAYLRYAPLHAATVALLASACGPAGQRPAAGPGEKKAVTELRIWFHWGGLRFQKIQELMEEYNATQGRQDKNVVKIETVPDVQMLEKMTVAVAAGDPPDVWHANASPKVATAGGLIVELPREEQQYVRRNYVPGAIDLVTLEGKIWGYPTEFQARAHLYRKSHYRDAGIAQPPASLEDVLEHAVKLTRRSGGTHERFGFLLLDGRWLTSQIIDLIGRFGGQMYHFNGDTPVKIDVVSDQAMEAVGWWRQLVERGVTQVGVMDHTEGMRRGIAAATECWIWYITGNTRDLGLNDLYEDYGGVVLPPKRGLKPVVYAGGWMLAAPKGAKQPEERWKLMRWMMYKPEMRFSRFLVEFVGSMPAPTDYPNPMQIPGWTDELRRVFGIETPKIAQMVPTRKLLGVAEMNPLIEETLQAIITGNIAIRPGLQQLNERLNEILKRYHST